MTNQRKVILEELRKSTEHLSADELYILVREKLPNISISTVYRNLEALSECGLVGKLELGKTQKRFDANVEPHFHIRCVNCGRLDDVPFAVISKIEKAIQEVEVAVSKLTGYEMKGYQLEFLGICPKCKEKMKNQENSTNGRKDKNGDKKDQK